MAHVFYKPNKSIKGMLTSFSFSSKLPEDIQQKPNFAVWVNFTRQSGWDSQKNVGSFRYDNKEERLKNSLNIKLNTKEIGGLIRAINKREKFSAYHSTDKNISQISFSEFTPKDKKNPIGFLFSVLVKENKDDNGERWGIGFDYDEAEELRVWFENALVHIFDGEYSLEIKKFKDSPDRRKDSPDRRKDSPDRRKDKNETSVKAEDGLISNEPEDDDIPF